MQRQIEIQHIGRIVVGPTSQHKPNGGVCLIIKHQKDGLLTLIEDVRAVAIFFYRGDSQGEGGSGQWVLGPGPVAFHVLLARLLDGGLICTDGSNCGYYDDFTDRYAPWNAFVGIRPFSAPTLGDTFEYANRKFTLVSVVPVGTGLPLCVWQLQCST